MIVAHDALDCCMCGTKKFLLVNAHKIELTFTDYDGLISDFVRVATIYYLKPPKSHITPESQLLVPRTRYVTMFLFGLQPRYLSRLFLGPVLT